jgi:type II secretory pathway pseudopilin PulG
MRSFRRQSGFSLLEVMLAVTVAIALGSMQLSQIQRETEDAQARAVGEQLKTVGQALNTYIAMQYGYLVTGASVVGAGTADDPGPRTCTAVAGGFDCVINENHAPGDPDALAALGLVPNSFSGQNAYGSQYEYFIQVRGTSPNWQVSGIVRTQSPYVVGGVIRYDMIGTAMYAAGADSGAVRSDVATITGLNGVWNQAAGDYPVGQLGQLVYRAGYGTSGYATYVRLDGTTPMSGDLHMGNHDIVNVGNFDAVGDVQAARLITTDPRADALVLGSDPAQIANRTMIGNSGNRLSISNAGGVQMLDGAGNGTPLLAGDINVGSVTSSSTGVFAGALQAEGLSTTGGANIHSSGQITAVGDFTTTNGSFRTTDGSFITTNGNISAAAGTISAGSLSITGAATIGNNLTFNANGAGWFYNSAANTMTLGNNANLTLNGTLTAGNEKSSGLVEAGTFLRLSSTAAAGGACTAQNFAATAGGQLLQCVGGTYKVAGGINSVTTVNSATTASAGATVSAVCPTGYKMISGGHILEVRLNYNDPTAPAQSYGDPSGNRWVVSNPPDGNGAAFRAQAVCAN